MPDDRLERAFHALTEVMAVLRKECPWDREQTHASLRRYLLEETYEVLEALDRDDPKALRGELGDLMFQVWFHAEVASERGADGFDLADVLEGITQKLTRRHPHVFGDVRADDAETVLRNWEQLKLAEGRKTVLDGVPVGMPALATAQAVQDKAAAVGFDWTEIEDVASKVREEVEELIAELPRDGDGDGQRRTATPEMRAELGDLLFALVNYGRHLGLTAEDCLREANTRFARRFRAVDARARAAGRSLADMTLGEMDALWDEVKADEGGAGGGADPGDG